MQKNHTSVFVRILKFYLDGFRQMTIGKTLWLIIFIKLFVIFFVLKLFFFPNFLKGKNPEQKSEYVSEELLNRVAP
ncbi:DUF4492 domain-containing protein [Phocaeicola oris]|uniref:DUF4492 domain-containing protein n=1 Tax=Phocaeicola oris TaxID=2896850 RepID=UPI00234EB2B8|nr:DUF4492 domain-containing protein [Phocaeicola oris]MCE2616468.1 DUF4492 domain-containing protein [Phocaeicola oris]